MKEQSDLSLFAKYVSLNVLSMIGLSCYILADTYFIANGIGENGLTALNLAIPVYSFISGVGLMLGIGGAAKYAIFQAQETKNQGNQVFTMMLLVAAAFAVIFMFPGSTFAYPIAELLGANTETLEMTGVYLKTILLFSPAFLLNNILNAFVKNDGNPQLSMVAMFTGCMFNIIFDYIFIFPMQMGMLGAVLATGFAPVVGIAILSVHLIRKQNHFHLVKVKMNISMMLSAVSIGIPSLVTEMSSGIVMILYNILILKLVGNVGVAAYGIIANIVLVVLAIYSGIAQGMQPILSEAYGRGNKERLKNILFYGVVTVLIMSAVIYSGLFVYTDRVSALFNRDANEKLQQIANAGIRWYFTGIPFAGLNIVLALYFASAEKAFPAQIISILRGFILIIPLVFLLSVMFRLTGVWISFPVTEILTAIVGIFFYKRFS